MQFARRYLDSKPVVVVTVDGRRSKALSEELQSVLGDITVEHREGNAVVDSAQNERVSCVVATRTAMELDLNRFVNEITDLESSPGLVLVTKTVDDEVAEATTAGSVSVVPASDETAVANGVVEAVETRTEAYLECLEQKLKSDALDSLFEQTDQTFFLKDEEAQYLKRADSVGDADETAVVEQTEDDLGQRRDDHSSRYQELDMEVLSTGDPLRETVTASNECERQFESTTVPWTSDDDTLRGLVGYRRQLTDQRARSSRLSERNEELERFIEYVTHDLKNPLMIADGYLDLAKSGDEDALERVDDAITRMDELIDDVKHLAAGAHETDDQLVVTNLHDVVQSVWEVTGKTTDRATLTNAVPKSTRIVAVEAELRPLFENLFANALTHADGDVAVRVGTVEDGFYVADDGPGIPEEERDIVFKRGYTTGENGTGTGLTIVSDVAETNAWEVSVTDSRNGGARFEIHNAMQVTASDRDVSPTDPVDMSVETDIGTVDVPGESTYDEAADRWTVSGEGTNIWREQNAFHYVAATVEGPVRIEGTVTDIEAVYRYSKAGFMVRNALDEAATHGYIGATANGETETLWCTDRDDETTSQQIHLGDDEAVPIRIDREGSVVTCSVEFDGEWQAIDQRRLPLSDPVHVGLAVCSVTPGELCTALFENVSVQQLEKRVSSDESEAASRY